MDLDKSPADDRSDAARRPVFDATITPHRSLGQQGFRIVMTLVCLASVVSSIPFVVLGAWPVAGFFGIVIQIQAQAGGNLSEALGNLSRVLRDRKKMKAKVAALSMEAKASAAIIGALPFIVALLVYITSPHYIMILFTDPRGHLILGISGIWMSIGIFVMKNMVSFDI